VTRDLDPRSARVAIGIPAVLALLSMIGPFSIDTPFPAFEQMGRDLAVETHELHLVVTVYLLPFAVMSIFHGPLSMRLGRKPVIVGATVGYVAASVLCAFAPSLGWLLVGRAIQGLAAGGASIVSRTVIRDLFDGPQAQRLMSRVLIIFGIAPAIAPVVGGVLVQLGPWQLVFWFMAGLGLFTIAATLLVLPESHPAERRVPLRFGEVVRGLGEVLRVPAFHRIAWAATLVFGAQFLYIGGAAIFLVDLLGQGELDFWKLFTPMIGAMMLRSTLSGRLAGVLEPTRVVTLGVRRQLGRRRARCARRAHAVRRGAPVEHRRHLPRRLRQRAGLSEHPAAGAGPGARPPGRCGLGRVLHHADGQRGRRRHDHSVRRSLGPGLRDRGRGHGAGGCGPVVVAPGGHEASAHNGPGAAVGR
jgi:DHA1 family bicyclomycin/chloramphenicol resistance-like MFS transporter